MTFQALGNVVKILQICKILETQKTKCKVMSKNLTKEIEKFDSKPQSNTFANISTLIGKNVKKFDDLVYPAKLAVKKSYRKTSKFIMRNQRVQDFLLKSLDSFSEEHSILVSLIENGEAFYPNENDIRYVQCKHRITVTMRATKRISKLVKKPSKMLELLNTCIQARRTDKKYEIAY